MIYRSEVKDLDQLFINDRLSIESWQKYVEHVLPGLSRFILEDSSGYDFEKDIYPLVNRVCKKQERIGRLEIIFYEVLKDVDEIIRNKFERNLKCEIVLYLGLCNGAGWVFEHSGKTFVLLGLEKIFELHLDDPVKMRELIYHELGHVYQSQYGTLNRKLDNRADELLWQLYTEGIAVYFQESITNDFSFYHQKSDACREGLQSMLPQLKRDFKKDLQQMNDRFSQRYFGDWVSYNGYADAGYYLGLKFVEYLSQKKPFNDILDLEIEEIKTEYDVFCEI
ncbi:MAG TPA: hypothetical protein PLI19_01255 [Erysipelotrichaceae bacterium]|jgi:hypothetical protein|nr:hypothetical protein [Erysipelotrichaceae bacterium]HQB31934.1 hypothetical protein [Erysipelotrichaceae bacterium]